jgi:ABC-type dipeptide/oligopeptide/nickel transport system ATPase subunit
MENREHNDQRANIQNQENAAQKVTSIGLSNKTNRKYVSTRSGGERKA